VNPDGRRRAIACCVSNQLSTRRYERHFFSGFIRTIKPLSRNEPRKASAISWISNLTTESFIRIKGSGTFTAYATRSSIDLGIVGDTKTSEFAGDPASPGAPRGPSVWSPRFPSRLLRRWRTEGHSPNIARIAGATQGQVGFQLNLLQDNALLFAPRIVFRFR
jgi:hypothetical protein